MKSLYFLIILFLVAFSTSNLLYAGITPEMSFEEATDEIARINSEFEVKLKSRDPNQIREGSIEFSKLFDAIQLRIGRAGPRITSEEVSFFKEVQFLIVSVLFQESFETLQLTLPEYLSLYVTQIEADDTLPESSDLLRRTALNLSIQCGDLAGLEKHLFYITNTWLKHTGPFLRGKLARSLHTQITHYLNSSATVDAEERQSLLQVANSSLDTAITWELINTSLDR